VNDQIFTRGAFLVRRHTTERRYI